MSVQNESLDIKAKERKPHEAPELEYKAATQDSLSMFFAAIGGAVLGMLATLLVLALINGGTLNFTHPERLAVMEANLTRVNENVGAVSQNIDTVAGQVNGIRDELAAAQTQLNNTLTQLNAQGTTIDELNSAVDTLAVTGQKFDTFVLAMDQAIASMKKLDSSSAVPAAAEAPRASANPSVVSDSAVKPGEVAVLFFVDANGNGMMDDSENNVVGMKVAVSDTSGKSAGEYTSSDGGVLVKDLKPGAYKFTLAGNATNKVAGNNEVSVTVGRNDSKGQIVYVPVAQ